MYGNRRNTESRDLDFGTEWPDLPEPWFPYIIPSIYACVSSYSVWLLGSSRDTKYVEVLFDSLISISTDPWLYELNT